MLIYLIRTLVIFAGLAICSACLFGFRSNSASIGPDKGRARFQSMLSIGFACYLIAAAFSLDHYAHPLFTFKGTLLADHIDQPDSKHFSRTLTIQTSLGGMIQVHADYRSAIRPGQHLDVQYEGDTGFARKLHLYDANGNLESTWNSPAPLQAAFLAALGLFFSIASWFQFQRDPDGEEEDRVLRDPVNSVDEASLLHLSQDK